MEVSGFGPGDLSEPSALARATPGRTFERRVIVYHDWGRLNATFNFINETGLEAPHENDFGYAAGLFRQPERMEMSGMPEMAGMTHEHRPSKPSLRRLGYGAEMIGALGNTEHFGFYWRREQQYLGPVFSYDLSPGWSWCISKRRRGFRGQRSIPATDGSGIHGRGLGNEARETVLT